MRPADPELMRREAMAAPLGIGFIVSALLALRVSFGLAATAVDLRWSPRRSWAYGRGNSWTIIGSLFVVLFAGAIATSIAVIVPLSPAAQSRRRHCGRHRHLDDRDPRLLRQRRADRDGAGGDLAPPHAWREGVPLLSR